MPRQHSRGNLPLLAITLTSTLFAWGCDDGTAPGTATPAATPPLKMAPGYSYDGSAPWTSLTEEELAQPINKKVKAHLEKGSPIGVARLGDRIRVANTAGYWRVLTMTILDAGGNPLQSVRLDLPPKGVVRGPSPIPADLTGKTIGLRFAEPRLEPGVHDHLAEGEAPIVPKERQIGIQAPEFTGAIVKKMGWIVTERTEGSGVSTEKWTASVASAKTELRPGAWMSVQIGKITFGFAGHGKEDGEPPTEAWWAQKAAEF